MIRLLIADDHMVVREGLEALFSITPGVEVVGVAADGQEAVAQADRLDPDVVLMDLGMPRVDGFEATRRISTGHPDCRVVVLSAYGDRARIETALEAGAVGYLLKHSSADAVVDAVRAASAGERGIGLTDLDP
jgi:two-component system, NarL family, response regulator LiaR